MYGPCSYELTLPITRSIDLAERPPKQAACARTIREESKIGPRQKRARTALSAEAEARVCHHLPRGGREETQNGERALLRGRDFSRRNEVYRLTGSELKSLAESTRHCVTEDFPGPARLHPRGTKAVVMLQFSRTPLQGEQTWGLFLSA